MHDDTCHEREPKQSSMGAFGTEWSQTNLKPAHFLITYRSTTPTPSLAFVTLHAFHSYVRSIDQ